MIYLLTVIEIRSKINNNFCNDYCTEIIFRTEIEVILKLFVELCRAELLARAAASFMRPLLSVDVSACLCVGNFDAKYLGN